jgi:hypothetical protein
LPQLKIEGAGPNNRNDVFFLDLEAEPKAAVQEAMEGERLRIGLLLEKRLGFLGTLGANAPFIGLFGTVLGIIHASKDLALLLLCSRRLYCEKLLGNVEQAPSPALEGNSRGRRFHT